MHPNNDAAQAMAAAIEHYRRGDLARAEAAFAEAARLAPANAEAHNALGVVVAARGRVDEALAHFRAATEADPRSVAAATNRADAALNLGLLDEARATLDTALALAPDDVALRALHAETLAAANLPREALESATRWAALAPDDALAQRALGMLASRVGAFDVGLAALRRARSLDAGGPDEDLDLRGIAGCLEFARFDDPDAGAEAEVAESLYADGVESQSLARVAADLVVARLAAVPGRAPETLADAAEHGWADSRLLITLLERTINVDPRIERVLVGVRRALLDAFEADGRIPAPWRRTAAAMATQCFVNEHAWPVEVAEDARAARLARDLDARAGVAIEATAPGDPGDRSLADLLIVVGLYRPIAALPSAGTLAASLHWPAALGPLVPRALHEPLAERELAMTIPRATIEDAVSEAVRAQYEESPYPRWVDLPEPNPEPLVRQLADQFPRFDPSPVLQAPHRILIAGCGSGRHPLRVARGDREAQIVAIDLSVASLAYARRRATELGIDNVEFRQHDILDARTLPGAFAVVESSGVIHHMHDPAAGLAALAAKLAPGGVMKLGLYSRRARRLVNLARERIAALGLDASPESMRGFRADVLAGRIPGLSELADSSDVYALSALRDLLFHVQEHQFSPPEVGALLDAEGLVFLGFQLPAFSVLERFRERFPGPGALTDLERWDRFEDAFPGTFANTYQLWCQKPD